MLGTSAFAAQQAASQVWVGQPGWHVSRLVRTACAHLTCYVYTQSSQSTSTAPTWDMPCRWSSTMRTLRRSQLCSVWSRPWQPTRCTHCLCFCQCSHLVHAHSALVPPQARACDGFRQVHNACMFRIYICPADVSDASTASLRELVACYLVLR